MLLAAVVNMEIKNFTISIKLVNTKNFNLVWKERDITDTGQLNVAIKILSGIRENVTCNALNLLFKQSAVKNLGVFKF
ncbi:conserved hypothetical protein [Aggregatibacter segnis ATCC 33393]|uniref:Uncharacterized protein n=1 Tax=Aggregatibacter segnis ATCC 33393 TaxID=888057 RepID=E6KV76_9PAST|nr:conserved hypothetical protein [Aggregatibacter segnis ATCC 33393]